MDIADVGLGFDLVYGVESCETAEQSVSDQTDDCFCIAVFVTRRWALVNFVDPEREDTDDGPGLLECVIAGLLERGFEFDNLLNVSA